MKRVLFINRDPAVQSRVREILERRGDYSLTISATVEDARLHLKSNQVDFVLFDVDVAMNDGVNHFLSLKEEYPDIPIVATTPIRHGEAGGNAVSMEEVIDS